MAMAAECEGPKSMHSRGFRALPPGGLSAAAAYIFIATDIVVRSRAWELVSDLLRTALFGLILLMLAAGLGVSFFSGRVREALLWIAFLAVFLVEFLHFSFSNNASLNLNALAQMYGPLSFIFFVHYTRKGEFEYVAGAIFYFGAAYVGFYDIISLMNTAGLLSRSVLEKLATNDAERGVRIFCSLDIVMMVIFMCLTSGYNGRARIPTLALSFLAIYFARSRFFTVILFLCIGCYALRLHRRFLPSLCVTIFLGVTITYFWGVIDPSFNPFDFFAADTSGAVRQIEYDICRAAVWRDWLLGLGFPSSDTDLSYAVSSNLFSTSDVGAINVWAVFGLPGLAIYLFSTIPLIFGFRSFFPRDRLMCAFYLSGCLTSAYNAIAPMSLVNPGSLIFGIAMAFWIRQPGSARLRATGDDLALPQLPVKCR